MNQITNVLKNKCNTCHMLEPKIEMNTTYDYTDVLKREITVTCSYMHICEMYKEFIDSPTQPEKK